MKPVYMINGFLDSGKSSFLKFTFSQDYFKIRGNTLFILCEEGEEEFEASLLKSSKTILETIEEEEEFTVDNLKLLEKKWRPERIVIEYNGMWNNKNLMLPDNWTVEQQITLIDANSFSMYFNNMRAMVAEMVRKSELIIFNRCDNQMDNLATFRRNIKTVNAQAEVVFEDSKGEINEIFEEDLPYDLKSDTIVLTETSYGIWYLDMMDHLERYEGKKISFLAMVLKPDRFPKGYFVPGRLAMTCCAEDITFIGYPCKYEGADKVKNKQWFDVTVNVTRGKWPEYKGEGPILTIESITPGKKPKNEVISFS